MFNIPSISISSLIKIFIELFLIANISLFHIWKLVLICKAHILCYSALRNSSLGGRFQNLEIAQKVESVTLGVTGKTVTFFGRKLVQSIGFRNDTLNDIYYEKNMRKRRSR